MNKKGFTLIELLAVIVVLAILALILIPIVTTTIKNAKKGSAEVSAQHYVKAVELAVSNSELNKKHIPDGTYTIDSEGNLTGTNLPNGKLEIEATGTKPNGGTIVIKNGQVTTESTITVGDYDVKYDHTSKEYVATEKENSTTTTLCTANTSKVSELVYDSSSATMINREVGLLASESGAYTPGVTYTCELGDNDAKTFFVLETNGDNVSLIMDKNIDSNGKGTTSGNTVAWSSDGNNHKDDDANEQAVAAKEHLRNSTTSWAKLTESQISLPSASQIATASGKTFDGNNGASGFPTWLYGNLKVNPEGYWTSTPDASFSAGAWHVGNGGSLGSAGIGLLDNGIRPVITVAKSQLG